MVSTRSRADLYPSRCPEVLLTIRGALKESPETACHCLQAPMKHPRHGAPPRPPPPSRGRSSAGRSATPAAVLGEGASVAPESVLRRAARAQRGRLQRITLRRLGPALHCPWLLPGTGRHDGQCGIGLQHGDASRTARGVTYRNTARARNSNTDASGLTWQCRIESGSIHSGVSGSVCCLWQRCARDADGGTFQSAS